MSSHLVEDESMEKNAADVEFQPVADQTIPLPASLQGLSEEELVALEKKIVRKADLVILPIIGTLYILNYVDRQNLAAAKLQGILVDLNMSTTDFATAISILFVGYLPFQIPSNLIISSITRPGLYICVATIIWGTISASTAAVQSFQALLAIRVILGAAEAVFFPGVVYLLSSWYRKHEFGKRMAGLYIGQQVGNAFGGLIAAGCLKMDGLQGIRGWRWLFIIEGVVTIGVGGLSAFFLPEYPYNAKMLTQQERDMAVYRLEKEAGVAEGHEDIGTWAGFRIGLQDPKLYALVFFNMMSQAQGSIANFFPTIVASLNYDAINTLLLTAPPYVLAGLFYCVLTWYSDRKKTVYPLIIGCICVACSTYIIAMTTTNTGARYTAMMLMPGASVGPQLLLYKTINLHLPRPVAKRAAAIAMMNAIGGTSNIWASYLYINPPYFFPAFGCLFACAFIFAMTLTGYRFYVRRENRKLDEGGDAAQKCVKWGLTQEMVDLGWRYEGF